MGSGGELELGRFGGALAPSCCFDSAPFALGGAVAMTDVVGERVAEGVAVEVVGVLADELVERAEGRLDPVQVAGVGRGRNQLDVVGVGVGGSQASSGWRGCPGSSRSGVASDRRAGSRA